MASSYSTSSSILLLTGKEPGAPEAFLAYMSCSLVLLICLAYMSCLYVLLVFLLTGKEPGAPEAWEVVTLNPEPETLNPKLAVCVFLQVMRCLRLQPELLLCLAHMSCFSVLLTCLAYMPCLYVLLICRACMSRLYFLLVCLPYMSCSSVLLICRAYMSTGDASTRAAGGFPERPRKLFGFGFRV